MKRTQLQTTRRTALRVGALCGSGLTLPHLLQWNDLAQAAGRRSPTAKAIILLYMTGGPAQQETFDTKPNASSGYRGEYKPIATTVPGVQICELLPMLAKNAHRFSIIRSMYHESNDHGLGAHSNLTGIDLASKRNAEAKATRSHSPCLGSVVSYLQRQPQGLPASVHLPNRVGDQNAFQWPGQKGGFLGSQFDPLMLIDEKWNPGTALPNFSLPSDIQLNRLTDRTRLLSSNTSQALSSVTPTTRDFDRYQQKALQILSSPTAWKAFNISEEKPQTVARYGDNRFGRSVLVARRLVEAGVRVITVTWMLNHSTENFDTHFNHFKLMKKLLLPPVDRAFSALLEDLDRRGLLDSTMVAWTGEFGRTPRINKRAGRDHWAPVYSTVLAGGGVKGGRVIGRSDRIAGQPADDPHHVSDFFATMYHSLGYNAHTRVKDLSNRPHDIFQGTPIRSLF